MRPESNSPFFRISGLFVLVVLVLFALHQDFWLRDNARLIAGFPAGLLYHLGYCLLVSLVLGLFVSRKR